MPTYEVVIVYFLILEAIIKSIYAENITLNLGLHFHQNNSIGIYPVLHWCHPNVKFEEIIEI